MQDGLFPAPDPEDPAHAGQAPAEPWRPADPAEKPAAQDPVARVVVESPLPHLDRTFDYLVPEALDEQAVAGARVRVSFAGRELHGYIVERRADSDVGTRLSVLDKVISPVPVLTPGVLELCRAVAARCAGSVSDVLRLAVPGRVASCEKDWIPFAGAADAGALPDGGAPSWDRLRNGAAFIHHLSTGENPRAAVTVPEGYGPHAWPHVLAQAAAAALRSGRNALLVVPDQRDLKRLERAVTELVPRGLVARLTADDGPSVRYREYLRVLGGYARVVIGTRAAAYAPLSGIGLVALWDDGDDVHAEPRAPYPHVRDVLMLRASQGDGAACLLAAHARSTEAQRLVENGWARSVEAERHLLRAVTPRVVNTADSYHQERDPLSTAARLPHAAWQAAKDALALGPVLIQVARGGYAPALLCAQCGTRFRCTACEGPLHVPAQGAAPECRWCGTVQRVMTCRECGSGRYTVTGHGVLRTAEQLGRAFPGARVISSSAGRVKDEASGAGTLVVATLGAEPVAPEGYSAALLLDGDQMLRRENLRAVEETVRRWFNAAALVRPAKDGGVVMVTADQDTAVGSLVRWDPASFASRELEERRSLGLPPAVRVAALTGPKEAVAYLQESLLPLQGEGSGVRTVGPVPVGEEYRTLAFIPYAMAAEAARLLRAAKAAASAKRSHAPAQVRFDGVDLL
ncbi:MULTISPECIES: primosomal protein N' [Arthrobacter]|uniref:Probable replication restart protein PriA n=2 Tax=Arthrobacter TaxID=1663 RepID=A0ABU9KIL3_9MICC|nr:primosomal protein N' [Arthrobacter sp. YJM1]MDP5226037.1 primosomal protein N' [Arthrobacter sp. YJM1]